MESRKSRTQPSTFALNRRLPLLLAPLLNQPSKPPSRVNSAARPASSQRSSRSRALEPTAPGLRINETKRQRPSLPIENCFSEFDIQERILRNRISQERVVRTNPVPYGGYSQSSPIEAAASRFIHHPEPEYHSPESYIIHDPQMQRIVEAALSGPTLDELLPNLLRCMRDIVNVDVAAIHLAIPNSESEMVNATLGLDLVNEGYGGEKPADGSGDSVRVQRCKNDSHLRMQLGSVRNCELNVLTSGFSSSVINQRRSIAVEDTARSPLACSFWHKRGITSVIGIPLVVDEQELGVMYVGTRTPRRFSYADNFLADRGGEYFSRALANALRYDEGHRAKLLQSAFIETSLDGVMVIDEDGCVVELNSSALTIFGCIPSQIVGQRLYDVILPGERRERQRRVLQRYMASRRLSQHRTLQITALRHDRNEFPMEFVVRRLPLTQQSLFMVTLRDVTQSRQVEASEERLRAFNHHLTSALEEERTHLAREIHDELGQALTGLSFSCRRIGDEIVRVLQGQDNVAINDIGKPTPADSFALAFVASARVKDSTEAIVPTVPLSSENSSLSNEIPAEVKESIAELTSSVGEIHSTVRRIAKRLRPLVLDDLGLGSGMEWQLQQFEEKTKIPYVWENLIEGEVGKEQATALFRILQEALTNIARHSGATEIIVTLFDKLAPCGTQRALHLQVVDNGRGITKDEQQNSHSLGLVGMRERASLLGGDLEVVGEGGIGTTVDAWILSEPSSSVLDEGGQV